MRTAPKPHCDNDYRPLFGSPISGWYRWFAWRPIDTADRGWQWFRVVYRRRIQKHQSLTGGADFWFQHAVALSEPRSATLEGGK